LSAIELRVAEFYEKWIAMNKERKEFLTSKHKAGLMTNIHFVYALDSCMALWKNLNPMQQKSLFAFHTRKWKSLAHCNSRPRVLISLTTTTFLLHQTASSRVGRGKAGEATVKYSNIVAVHVVKIRTLGYSSRAPYITEQKNFTSRPIYPADVRLSWSQSPSGLFGEENFSFPCRNSNQDSSVVQSSH
jgi:hypothetical protein